MSEERDEAGARILLRELTTEVLQWAEWTQALGADSLPAEPALEIPNTLPESRIQSPDFGAPTPTLPAAPGPSPALSSRTKPPGRHPRRARRLHTLWSPRRP